MNDLNNLQTRLFVSALGLLLLVAGLLPAGGSGEAEPVADEESTENAGPALPGLKTGAGEVETASTARVLQHSPEAFVDSMMSGGPPPDGIPSIDQPRFVAPEEAELAPGDPIIGLAHGGVVRAYPQRILVYHEIVNQTVGGENLAVTYCPLTATAQAFKSGSTTLGVSGRLVNSNLVMYDRDTGSLWPQIGGTAVAGPRKGESLEEVEVYWTSWENWLEMHPETEVLSTDTGHARNYNRDPYGSYNPAGGYYTSPRTMFPLMEEGDRYETKQMVLGARNSERAVYFDLESLAGRGIQETESFIAVYDRELETGHIYEKNGNRRFRYEEGMAVDTETGDRFAPGELPFTSLVSIEGFYFAWAAFYPESEHPR